MDTTNKNAESSNLNSLDPDRRKELKELQERVNVQFTNLELLDQAFTHRSYTNECRVSPIDNERLEFLGDSVLGLIAAKFLYFQNPKVQEGTLSKWKSKIVSGPILASICEKLGIAKYLRLGKGEYDSGKNNKRLLENLLEALLGALYLDQGFEKCESFILPHLKNAFKNLESIEYVKDYKSTLQEICQKNFKKTPRYEMVSEVGLDHDKEFTMCVVLPNGMRAIGKGKSKKSAQQNAAKKAIELWNLKRK